TYYLYHYTRDPQYRKMGEGLFNNLVRYCRADAGYASLADVTTKQKQDEMESFVLAETFKYFYLLFASPKTLDFDKVVFNTEAHPLQRTWCARRREETPRQSEAATIGCSHGAPSPCLKINRHTW